MEKEEYFYTEECAEFLRTSPGAIRNKAMRRQIPFRKRFGRLIFLKSELKEWIDSAPGVRLEDLKRKEDS